MSAFGNPPKNPWAVYIAIPFSLSTSLWAILGEITQKPIFDVLLIACASVCLFLCIPLNFYLNRKKEGNEAVHKE